MLLSVINAEGRKEAELSGHNEKSRNFIMNFMIRNTRLQWLMY